MSPRRVPLTGAEGVGRTVVTANKALIARRNSILRRPCRAAIAHRFSILQRPSRVRPMDPERVRSCQHAVWMGGSSIPLVWDSPNSQRNVQLRSSIERGPPLSALLKLRKPTVSPKRSFIRSSRRRCCSQTQLLVRAGTRTARTCHRDAFRVDESTPERAGRLARPSSSAARGDLPKARQLSPLFSESGGASTRTGSPIVWEEENRLEFISMMARHSSLFVVPSLADELA